MAGDHLMPTVRYEKKHKVTVVGSGNWGSTISKIVAENAKAHPHLFETEVHMWVHEEEVVIGEDSKHYDPAVGDKPQKLSSVINKYHENVKYLPNIRLPDNLIANPSLADAAAGSSILVFNLPHQFIGNACKTLNGKILPFARGISCIKGVNVSDEGIALFSEWIGEGLGIYCGALSGANIASEIAAEKWSGSPAGNGASPTGSNGSNGANGLSLEHKDARGRTSKVRLTPVPPEYPPLDHETFKHLFHRPYFHNIVALAAGFVVGRGWGDNAKSEIIRVGLLEMIRFGKEFFGATIHAETFTEESAGVADLVTSCSSGRNFKCARLAVERGVTVQEIERTELNGQMLQGTSTAHEVNSFLKAKGLESQYPLFTTVCNILEGRCTVDDIPSLVSP
ncbi:unnamed protein product [Parascedosporium putredinis]|uniref:Glycerol-3-phosphate dehydrogenase [NAD(+)] n=1 Tax=Parascedosporium putredinis TaxID=1442378 RepID=A0A9P1H5U9_9PEZI|nr:unnamed protein product [Parascedosporium putredinis]CAI7997436.1 unnamed protein product [Parascedosporium putredinis]